MPEHDDAAAVPREDHFTSTVEGAAAFERDRAHRAGEDADYVRIAGHWYPLEDVPRKDEL